MRNYHLLLLCAWMMVAIVAGPPAAWAQKNQQTIAAVVNQKAVTIKDVDSRLRLIMASSGLPPTPELMARLRPQILSMLIEERLKLDEATRLKINIEDSEIDKAIAEIAEQNKLSVAAFQTMLTKNGIRPQTLRDQIRGQLAWARVVTRTLRPQVMISDREIDAKLAQLTAKIGQEEFNLFEIVLPYDTAKEQKRSDDLARRLKIDLGKNPGLFPQLARQFSRTASAAQGGQVGWLSLDQMEPDVAKLVRQAGPRSVVGPVVTGSGLTLLGVRERRVRDVKNLPTRDEIGNMLGNERLDRLQRRYYQDLRAASFIDERI